MYGLKVTLLRCLHAGGGPRIGVGFLLVRGVVVVVVVFEEVLGEVSLVLVPVAVAFVLDSCGARRVGYCGWGFQGMIRSSILSPSPRPLPFSSIIEPVLALRA